jgi:ferric-dicitrate binding protein FerR (iron transport regulator)
MSNCDAVTESMALLLTESLDPARREHCHQHIEQCPACSAEWTGYQNAWKLLDELPVVEPPAHLKARFLGEVFPVAQTNVVPLHRKPAFKWLAQAAAIAVIAGGSFFAGHRSTPTSQPGEILMPRSASVAATPISFSIAESRTIPADAVSPVIQGRPDLQNVQFTDDNPNDPEIGVAFDLTSHVKVTGKPTDKTMVQILRYVLENEDHLSPSRQRAIDWVRAKYSTTPDPLIGEALANVLRNDQHEGVRIKAVDTLKNLPASASADADTHQALIDALKNDPNPAVRLKAVEALANLAKKGAVLDNQTLDILRQKASQGDENLYVRVKAAEALSNVHP